MDRFDYIELEETAVKVNEVREMKRRLAGMIMDIWAQPTENPCSDFLLLKNCLERLVK